MKSILTLDLPKSTKPAIKEFIRETAKQYDALYRSWEIMAEKLGVEIESTHHFEVYSSK
jgi:hypothetical protein